MGPLKLDPNLGTTSSTPSFSTHHLLLLLPLGFIPPLQTVCSKARAQKWVLNSSKSKRGKTREKSLLQHVQTIKLLCKRSISVRSAVKGEKSKRKTERQFVTPLQHRREERRRGGKIPLHAVRASDEEKRRAEGIG